MTPDDSIAGWVFFRWYLKEPRSPESWCPLLQGWKCLAYHTIKIQYSWTQSPCTYTLNESTCAVEGQGREGRELRKQETNLPHLINLFWLSSIFFLSLASLSHLSLLTAGTWFGQIVTNPGEINECFLIDECLIGKALVNFFGVCFCVDIFISRLSSTFYHKQPNVPTVTVVL